MEVYTTKPVRRPWYRRRTTAIVVLSLCLAATAYQRDMFAWRRKINSIDDALRTQQHEQYETKRKALVAIQRQIGDLIRHAKTLTEDSDERIEKHAENVLHWTAEQAGR